MGLDSLRQATVLLVQRSIYILSLFLCGVSRVYKQYWHARNDLKIKLKTARPNYFSTVLTRRSVIVKNQSCIQSHLESDPEVHGEIHKE